MLAVGGALLVLCFLYARGGDEVRSFTCAVAATLALSPIVWLHYLVVLLVPLAIARPRFSLLWLLPALLWVSPKPGLCRGSRRRSSRRSRPRSWSLCSSSVPGDERRCDGLTPVTASTSSARLGPAISRLVWPATVVSSAPFRRSRLSSSSTTRRDQRCRVRLPTLLRRRGGGSSRGKSISRHRGLARRNGRSVCLPAASCARFGPAYSASIHGCRGARDGSFGGRRAGTLWIAGVRDWRCYGLVLVWPPVISAIQTGNVTLWFASGRCGRVALPRPDPARRRRDRSHAGGEVLPVAARRLARRHSTARGPHWRPWRSVSASSSSHGRRSASRASSTIPTLLRRLEDTVGADSYTAYIVGLDAGLPSPVARALWLGLGFAVLASMVVDGPSG